MKYLLYLLLFTQVACAEEPQYINPGLKAYYDMYMVDAAKNHALVKMSYVNEINFHNLPSGKLAVCEINWQSTKLHKRIYVDPTEWATLHETARLEIIYHEMGHCAFKVFDHDPNPDHIMNTYNVTQWKDQAWIDANWSGMVKQYWETIY